MRQGVTLRRYSDERVWSDLIFDGQLSGYVYVGVPGLIVIACQDPRPSSTKDIGSDPYQEMGCL